MAVLWPAAALPAAGGACAAPRASPAYTAKVVGALESGRDLWGDQLLHAPGGPTFLGASGRLAPILYARSAKGRPLTPSGVYYLPFSEPGGPLGSSTAALHVADGSEIISEARRRAGATGERVASGAYGACVSKLAPARLASGWLPILETRYRGYSEESFAARISHRDRLARELPLRLPRSPGRSA